MTTTDIAIVCVTAIIIALLIDNMICNAANAWIWNGKSRNNR